MNTIEDAELKGVGPSKVAESLMVIIRHNYGGAEYSSGALVRLRPSFC